jgi:hypothetical protein
MRQGLAAPITRRKSSGSSRTASSEFEVSQRAMRLLRSLSSRRMSGKRNGD